ncbi:MAG: hypothetical protein JWL76_1265 [Thermoleophilia bacterium]|jgi:hypothetical protein|nr:hypothetical protein [Thermoleophilia bacterium]
MHHTRRLFVIGGLISSIVLIGFGVGSIVIGVQGRAEVRDSIVREHIVATPDAGSIAGKELATGADAKQFAAVIRKHTLEMTDGKTYGQMGRYLTADGSDTNDAEEAATDPATGNPTENGARNVWITSTALSTALSTSYFAEQVGLFSIVMGVALLITGLGFAVLTLGALRLPTPEHVDS